MKSQTLPTISSNTQKSAVPSRDKIFLILLFSLLIIFSFQQNSNAQIIAAWNPGTPTVLTGYGPSPWSPTTSVANVTIGGLTRGSGVGTANTAAGSAWGGTMSTANVATSAAAVTANQFVTFTIAANSTYKVSLSTLDLYYRRSSTGPASGTLQYAIGAGAFNDITTYSFSTTTSGGAALPQVNLSSISDLQNVVSGNTIKFRIVLYGNGAVNGPFYVFSTGLSVGGTVLTTSTSAVLANITQPTGTIIQGNTNTVLSGFTITPTTSVDFTGVTVSSSGTATTNDITNVRIYRDNNADGIINGADAAVSGSLPYSSSMAFTGITTETGFATVRNYLVVADLASAGPGVSNPGTTTITSVASGAFTTTATSNTGSATGSSRTIIAPPGTSTLTPGVGVEPLTISSLTNTQGAASLNFDFTITDDGATSSTDNSSSLISQIVINAGTGNTITNWSTAIAGVELNDGTNSTTTATIGASSITFAAIPTSSGALGEILDNASKTYTLKVWLKSDLTTLKKTIDGLGFVFRIQTADITVAGSQLDATQDVNSGSGNNIVDVTATALTFLQQPSNTNPNVAMTPADSVAAIDANGNRDLSFVSLVRITSTGALNGSPVDVAAVSGVATFNSIIHTANGIGLTLTAKRASTLDWAVTSNTFNILPPATLTEIILPQYAVNGGTTAARMQYVCRLGINNLIPNATYRYITGSSGNMAGNMVVINNTSGTGGYIAGYTAGKGLGGTLSTANEVNTATSSRYGELTTDANGSYTGWFTIVPTGNASFAAGTTFNLSIQLNNGANGTTVATTVTTASTITSIGISTGATGGRAIRGTSSATSENMIFLYDNVNGVGRPISGTWAEDDGMTLGITWYDAVVNGVSGSWGTLVPTVLPNGIRRIEQRDVTTGLIAGCVDSASTGVWPTGSVNTVNPTGGTASPLVISNTDASFICPIYNTISTGAIASSTFCVDGLNGAAVLVPFTSTYPFNSGNIYTAQLSNAGGVFPPTPVTIGTLNSTNNLDTVHAIIPAGTLTGTGYRIRVVSSSPLIIGTDNGTDLTLTGGTTFYADNDIDGYGDDFNTTTACIIPNGYVAIGGDCNDFDGTVNPGVSETCNGADDNCDGNIDEGLTFINYYVDGDGDGFGTGTGTSLCSNPGAGYSTINTDCNDAASSIHPGATEICSNGVDDNCNGQIDEGCGFVTLNLKIYLQGFYAGSGLMNAVLYNNGNSTDPSDVDSINIELHDTIPGQNNLVETATGLLKTNGSLQLQFSSAILTGTYYIVVKQRNSIETWSKFPVTFNPVTNYDFTD